MKVIIVGAGKTGFVSAKTVADVHDVLMIEKDEDVAETAKSRLNVDVLREDGTNPKVLRRAIENQDTDVIVSALHSDTDNLFVCMMAKRIKPEIHTVATVSNPDFVIDTASAGFPGVDNIISPNIVSSEKMYKLCVLENAVEYESLKDLGVCVAVFKIERRHAIVGKIVMHLEIPYDCTVFAIYRDNTVITESETAEIRPGDRICVFGSERAITEFNSLVGVEDASIEFAVLGGSVIGKNLAKLLAADERKRYVKIVEKDSEVCRLLSRELTGIEIVNADYTDPDIQHDEGLFRTDTVVSTSGRDETNLLICMSAKRHGARKIVARFFMREYEDIFRFTDIQTIIGHDRIISNEIIKCVLTDDQAIARMQSSDGIFFTYKATADSKLVRKFVGDLDLPDGLRVVAIRRDDSLTYPLLTTVIGEGDGVIMFFEGRKATDVFRILGRNAVPELQS